MVLVKHPKILVEDQVVLVLLEMLLKVVVMVVMDLMLLMTHLLKVVEVLEDIMDLVELAVEQQQVPMVLVAVDQVVMAVIPMEVVAVESAS